MYEDSYERRAKEDLEISKTVAANFNSLTRENAVGTGYHHQPYGVGAASPPSPPYPVAPAKNAKPALADPEFAEIAAILAIDFTDETSFLVDGRALHSALKIGRQFAPWINGRLVTEGLEADEDYIICSPVWASKECGEKKVGRGGHNIKEYRFTIGAAGVLASAERGEIGRLVRRFFVACRRELDRRDNELARQPKGPDFSNARVACQHFMWECEKNDRLMLELAEAEQAAQVAAHESGLLKTSLKIVAAGMNSANEKVETMSAAMTNDEKAIPFKTFCDRNPELGYGQNCLFKLLVLMGVLHRVDCAGSRHSQEYAVADKNDVLTVDDVAAYKSDISDTQRFISAPEDVPVGKGRFVRRHTLQLTPKGAKWLYQHLVGHSMTLIRRWVYELAPGERHTIRVLDRRHPCLEHRAPIHPSRTADCRDPDW